jgi:hypothetical protein
VHNNRKEEGRKKVKVGIFIKEVEVFQFGL